MSTAPTTHGTHEKPFFCKAGCGKQVMSDRAPEGWYTVQRKAGDGRYARLGMYCSAMCLATAAAQTMYPSEVDMGEDWVNRVSLNTPFQSARGSILPPV